MIVEPYRSLEITKSMGSTGVPWVYCEIGSSLLALNRAEEALFNFEESHRLSVAVVYPKYALSNPLYHAQQETIRISQIRSSYGWGSAL